MFAPMTAQVLPDGMTRLTPEGLELGSVMSVANPLGPKEHAVRTENFLFFAGKGLLLELGNAYFRSCDSLGEL